MRERISGDGDPNDQEIENSFQNVMFIKHLLKGKF